MPSEKKVKSIKELQGVFSESSIVMLTDYRGLKNAEITNLRRSLEKSNISYRVVKNTMARFAAEKADKNEFADMFKGPVAIAFGCGDEGASAKVLADYIRSTKLSLNISGGILGDRLLSSADVANLATLPSREILIAKVLGGLQSPIYGLVNCLASPMRGFMGVLQARIKQLEGE